MAEKDNSPKPSNTGTFVKNQLEKVSETLQYIGIIAAVVMGLRQPPKAGEAIMKDKQVPDWLLSAFPSITDDDEIEYPAILASLASTAAKIAAEEFEENVKKEGIYDEVTYRVRLVESRRDFLEKTKNPAPKDDSGGRLAFGKLTLKDAVKDFMNRLFAEVKAGGTPEEIFERQKRIAINRKLLEKKHFLKKLSENKVTTIVWVLFVTVGILALLKKILS